MKINNEKLGFSFDLPDQLTVRQQLQYRGRMGVGLYRDNPDMYLDMWKAALSLIENWECEQSPDPNALDLDTVTDVKIADIVAAVGMDVFLHTRKQEEVEKN